MYSRPLCQTLSKALEMSKNTPLTSVRGLLSKLVCISWTIDKSWAIHESPGRKPDCQGVKSLLLTNGQTKNYRLLFQIFCWR